MTQQDMRNILIEKGKQRIEEIKKANKGKKVVKPAQKPATKNNIFKR